MIYTIKAEDIKLLNESVSVDFPKYTTQIINLANQNAGGTRPRVVGQLSNMFPEFEKNERPITIPAWYHYYLKLKPNAFVEATDKIYAQVQNLKEAINLIDRKMVYDWVVDLIVNKTFNGLHFQGAILAFLAKQRNTSYRLANPDEEAKGIDGYVGKIPYSIKPDSYKMKNALPEIIEVKMIYYSETSSGNIKIDVEE